MSMGHYVSTFGNNNILNTNCYDNDITVDTILGMDCNCVDGVWRIVFQIYIEELEAVARVALKGSGRSVSDMTSTELKRDMLIWAKNNTKEVRILLDDENIKLRNVAVRAVEMGILHIKDDQRTITWGSDKRQKIIQTPYGDNVYSALAAYFKTDEGLDVMQKITNLL